MLVHAAGPSEGGVCRRDDREKPRVWKTWWHRPGNGLHLEAGVIDDTVTRTNNSATLEVRGILEGEIL